MRACIALLPLLAACSNSRGPSTGPSPVSSSSLTITGSIADTVSGAVIGQFTQTVSSVPAQITVSQAGYVTRSTWVHSDGARVDLFPEAGFDLGFYRQFARGTLDGAAQPLRVLAQSPSIYLQTAGLSAGMVAALEAAAREAVSAFSGGRLQVVTWETGAEARAPRYGWITVEQMSEPSGCGRANVGTSTGRIWLNVTNTACSLPSTIGHEIGHALGFYHVDQPGALMRIPRPVTDNQVTPKERHHAALAYARLPGNQDVDVDPRSPSSFQTVRVVD